jgi:hypothetical protein
MLAATFVAACLLVPVAPAAADLLGDLTDEVEDTVDDLVTNDGVSDLVDETEETLDETVDDVGETLSAIIDDTSEELIDTTTTTSTPSTTTQTTTTTTTTTTAPAASTPTTAPPGAGSSPGDDASSRDEVTGTPGVTEQPTEGTTVAELPGTGSGSDPTALRVVAAAEPAPLSEPSGPDGAVYARLLGWLTAGGFGVLGVLAAPLLGLEILLRALLSAGSGLVAPLSLLASYLVRLIWVGRQDADAPGGITDA